MFRIHGRHAAGKLSRTVFKPLDGVNPEGDGIDDFRDLGSVEGVGECDREVDVGLVEVADIGVERGEGEGDVADAVVILSLVHNGVCFEKTDGSGGGFGQGQCVDFQVRGDVGGRPYGPDGVGDGDGFESVAMNVKGIGKAVEQGKGMEGGNLFGAHAEGFGIVPGGEDAMGDGGLRAEDGAEQASEWKMANGPAGSTASVLPEMVEEGKEGEGQAEGGEVGVAVGDRDGADENDSANGEEESGKGEEAGGETGATPEQGGGHGGYQDKEHTGGDEPGIGGGSARGEGAEVDGPDGTGDVEEIISGDGEQAVGEGNGGDGMVLETVGEKGEDDDQEEVGPFAESEEGEGAGCIAQGEAAERPIVEEEEEEGKGDEHGLGEEAGNKGRQCEALEAFVGGTNDKWQVTSGRRGLRPRAPVMRGRRGATQGKGLEVEKDGGEGEEGGEGVLALGDPGNGFDAEGVECPEGGGEEGQPGAADGGEEDEPEEDGVGGVEEDVGQVEAPGMGGCGVEKEGVEEIGNPEERGVHGLVAVEGGERASDGFPGKAVENDRIVDDEGGVVEVDEEVADGGSKECEGEQEEEEGREEGGETDFHVGDDNKEKERRARGKWGG